jgi:hypothetical protein
MLGEHEFLSGDDLEIKILCPVPNMRGQARQQFESPKLSIGFPSGGDMQLPHG